MSHRYKSFHVLTAIIFNFALLLICIASNNLIILLSIFILCFTIFYTAGKKNRITKGIIYFIPLALINIFINAAFTEQGGSLLFYIMGIRVTLEVVAFSFILAFKLLLVIYIFMLMNIMIDSDEAVSYFSSKMPKSTLMLMIAFKLLPTMKQKFKDLKEIYSIRGVNSNEKGIKSKIKSNLPILSILLESSLQGAFDIGEAAYLRGFLSGKRTIYDKQILRVRDFYNIALSLLVIVNALFILIKYSGGFEPSYILDYHQIVNLSSLFTAGIILTSAILIQLPFKGK